MTPTNHDAGPRRLRIFALGGNEVSPTGRVDPASGQLVVPDLAEQWQRTASTCQRLARIITRDPDDLYILTHGNGPQVGNILLRSEYSAPILHTLPLDVCDADTQGSMGYMLAQLSNALRVEGLDRIAAETVMQVVVDPDDASFQQPSKFIGPAYSKADALERQRQDWAVGFYKLDGRGQEIWRRVVPSPDPIDIVELDIIEAVLASGHIPIAVGGGGIPVARVPPQIEGGEEVYRCKYGILYRRPHRPGRSPVAVYSGVEAVIDKDLASSLLGTMLLERFARRGERLEAELVIFTDVDGVKLHFQQPDEQDLRRLSLEQAKAYDAQGIFPAGSMGPKVRAAIRFLEGGGARCYIGQVDRFEATVAGTAGTTIVP